MTPAHFGTIHHAFAVASSFSGSSTSGSSSSSSSSSSNTALTTAEQTLQNDIQAIELASGTTIGELTAIRVDSQKLAADGLTPTSASALSAFKDSLVTANAAGTLTTSAATSLSAFEALYTSSPTAQQTTDLTTAYNDLVAAVTSAKITSANLATINTDYAALLTAEGSTSTATYPYFSLVTGGHEGGHGGGCH